MLIANIEFLDIINDERHFSSVKSDYIDKEIFNEAMKDAEKLKQTIEERSEKTPFFEKLSEDLFNALYKVAPKVYNKANVEASLKIENELLNLLINNDNFNKLRKNTACDLFNSTYALSMFLEKAYKLIEDWSKKSKENKLMMDNINLAISYQEQLRDVKEQLIYDSENELLVEQMDNLKKLINQANNDILDLQKKLNTMDNILDTKALDNSLGDIITYIRKKISDDGALFKVFFTFPKYPGNEDGKFQKVSYEDKINLANILTKNSQIRHISRKLGKMRSFIDNVSAKPGRYGCIITGIGVGNNISRILNSEKVLLSNKDLENHFYKKYLNKTLLQYEVRGEDEIKGPIIVCVDNSESMKGQKEYFAKALAIAILQLAVLEKRPYRCILFDNSVNYVVDFKKREYDLKKVIELAEAFYGGGTEFEPPLKKAIETIEKQQFKKADILFITDGEPVKFLSKTFKEQLNLLKKRKNFIIQGIIIGNSNDKYMKEFCHCIMRFENLINKEEELLNILNNIKGWN